MQVKGHAAGVVALGFSPDGRKLLSIGAEGLMPPPLLLTAKSTAAIAVGLQSGYHRGYNGGATGLPWGYHRAGMDEDHTVALWDWKLGQRLIDAYLTAGKNEVLLL